MRNRRIDCNQQIECLKRGQRIREVVKQWAQRVHVLRLQSQYPFIFDNSLGQTFFGEIRVSARDESLYQRDRFRVRQGSRAVRLGLFAL